MQATVVFDKVISTALEDGIINEEELHFRRYILKL